MDIRSGERDFFISYRSADQAWAEWIAWELEAAGYTVFVQAWDFRPGQNFVHQMQQGTSSCCRTIAVLTPAYFESGFTRAEWYNAFAKDPTGEAGLLLPIRVEPCDIDGLLGQIIHIDLVGLGEAQARERLLAGIKGTRAKPPGRPDFPGVEPPAQRSKPAYPGLPSLPLPSAEDRRGLLILLNSVERDWIKGVLEQSVQHEALINLGMEARVGAVEHPWEQVLELPDAAGKLLPVDTSIADVFESVGRLLLILGEPGSGKTMTLLELARDLVARASSDPGQPVPVVFNLSSWTERITSLADWLTEELNSKYKIPKRIGRSWLHGNRLSLLLDGLDEVQADRRAACIRAINTFLEEHGTSGVAVCSRIQEYTAEPARLKMNGAICLQPLTAKQIETYLSRLGSQLDALRAALNKDDVLRDLARSPLMLSILTLSYQGTSIDALAGEAIETPEVRRNQIFATYVARMFARRPGRADDANQRTTSSLSWLAYNMQRHGQSIFLIEQMQPTWLKDITSISAFYSLSSIAQLILAVPLLILFFTNTNIMSPLQSVLMPLGINIDRPETWIVLVLVMTLWVFCDSAVSMILHYVDTHFCITMKATTTFTIRLVQIIIMLCAGYALLMLFFGQLLNIYIFSLVVTVASCGFLPIYAKHSRLSYEIDLLRRFSWSWSRALKVTGVVMLVAVLSYSGAVFTYTSEMDKNIRDMLLQVLLIAIISWPILVILFGVRTVALPAEQVSKSVISSIIAGAGSAATTTFTSSFISGSLLLLWSTDFQYYPARIYLAVAMALSLAFIVCLALGVPDIISHFILRILLCIRGRAPIRLADFLDSCTRLVFLRRVGGGYIFIHRLLLEHFAAMWEAEYKQKGTKGAVTSGSAVAAPN